MSTLVMKQRNKIHPHKFTLWVGIGSLLMMFAGLTSAYIVKRNLANWQTYDLKQFFWYSTIVILISSVTMYLAQKAFKQREMKKYRSLLIVTLVLGVLFIVFQVLGFQQLYAKEVTLTANVSYCRHTCGTRAGWINSIVGIVCKGIQQKNKDL